MSYNSQLKVYEGYIYLVTNLTNNKKYIGQTTTTVEERWYQHCHPRKTKSITLFDQTIQKYGMENFKVIMLNKYFDSDLSELKKKLDLKERLAIKKYNTMVYNGYGYNVDLGGQSNNVFGKKVDVYNMEGDFICTCSSKTEASLRFKCNERHIYDICHGKLPNYRCLCVFRWHNEPFDKYETKSKTYKEIYQFTLDGYLIDKYYSYDEINTVRGYYSVYQVIDNPYRIVNGYWWSSTNIFNYLGVEKKPTKVIKKYDLFGKLLKIYSSTANCSADTGFVRSAIINNCEGKNSNLGKYIFRYENDSFDKYDEKYRNELNIAIMIYYYPIKQYTKTGTYLKTYSNIRNIIDDKLSDSPRKILDCCLHKRTSVSNSIWRFSFDNNFTNKVEKTKKIFNAIDIYDLKCSFIKTLYSIEDCEEFFNKFNKNTLYSALYRNGTMNGYIVRKHGEKLEEYNDWRIPVDMYSLTGILLGEYSSIYMAAKSIGKTKIAISSIKQCLENVTTQAYNYVWRYHGIPFNEGKINKSYKTSSVNCYFLNDEFMKTFNSLKEASIFANRSDCSIIQCCKGISKTSGGYKWYYADDPNQPDKSRIIV